MSNWRDNLRKGSFRGVPFHWKWSDTDLGRRTARHDYPLRDDVWLEDMGKIPREFALEMYVIGADYMAARDRLAEAFEEAGPGTLVHPTFGTLSVVVSGRVRLRESTDEGGMARFSATFVLAGDNKFPAATVDTAGAVDDKARMAAAAAAGWFTRTFSVARQPAFVRAAALTQLQAVTARLQSIAALIPTSLSASVVHSDLVAFGSALGSLVTRPLDLAQNLVLEVNAILNLSDDPLARFGLSLDLFDIDWGWGTTSSATPSRRQQAANQAAAGDIVRVAEITAAATAAAAVEFASYQDAIAVRDRLLDRLDTILEAASDDEVYVSLAALRAAVVADIAARGADLARIVAYTPAQTLPALVLAYRLYGDPDQAEEIASRNKLSHPGFVPGGQPLEVLS